MTPARGLVFALAAVLLTFAPTLGFEFVSWDDTLHVLENPAVQAPDPAPRDVWLTPTLGYPIPLPIATYRLEHALVGNTPWLFHATNLAVHLGVCALLFALARRLGLSAAAATLATLLFGLHPAVAESVSWVSGRKDLLVTLFSLATVHVALLEETPTWRTRAGLLVGFVLALASKPVAVFLVPTIVAFRCLVLRRTLRESVVLVLPLLVPLAVYLPLAIEGQRALGAVRPSPGFAAHLRSIGYSLGVHSELVLLLREPCAKYVPPPGIPPFDPRIDLAPLLLAAILGGIAAGLPPARRRVLLATLVLTVTAYAPNSNLLPLTRYLADTYVLLPLLGISLALGLGFDRLLERVGDRAPAYAVGGPIVVAFTLALLTVPASARYHDSLALWDHARRLNPQVGRICRNWAVAVVNARPSDEALAAIDSCAARFGPVGLHRARGRVFLELGRHAEALAEFELALVDTPDAVPVREMVARMRADGILPSPITPTLPRSSSGSGPGIDEASTGVEPDE